MEECTNNIWDIMAGIRIRSLGTDELLERIKNKNDQPFILIDARDEEDYNKMHIPGAISMPVYDLAKLCDKLDKNSDIITYCSSFMCDASTDAAVILIQKGFKNVWEYKGGMQDWANGSNPTE